MLFHPSVYVKYCFICGLVSTIRDTKCKLVDYTCGLFWKVWIESQYSTCLFW